MSRFRTVDGAVAAAARQYSAERDHPDADARDAARRYVIVKHFNIAVAIEPPLSEPDLQEALQWFNGT